MMKLIRSFYNGRSNSCKSVFLVMLSAIIFVHYSAQANNKKSVQNLGRKIAQTDENEAVLKGEMAPGDETSSTDSLQGSDPKVSQDEDPSPSSMQNQQAEVAIPNGNSVQQEPMGEARTPAEPEFKTVRLKTTDSSKNSKSFVDLNNQGLAALKTKNYYLAVEKFAAALGLNPYSAEAQINFAIALEELGKTEEALKALQSSANISDNPEVKFVSEYNQGVLLSKGEDKEAALLHYQNALDVNPESFETKVNIELLTKEESGKGKGKGDKDDKNDKDQKDNKDKKDKGDGKDQDKDQKDKDQGEQPKEDQPKKYGKNNPQPKPFKSEELTQGDVNKILNELRQQEQKIRAEFNKKIIKEKPRDKDW